MKKFKPIYPNLLLLAIASLVMNSCYFINDCIDGNGEIITESRLVSEFHSVENTTSVDVDIIADTIFSVEVTADENLLQFIDTYVRGGNLVIDNDYTHCFNQSGDIYIEIHMPTIKKLESSGSGDIALYDFDVDEFKLISSGSGNVDLVDIYATDNIIIESSGSGDISVSGKSIIGDYMLTGSGDIRAADLRLEECYVYSSGSGDVYCFVYDKLDVTIKGSGDVYFEGPVDDKEIHEYNTGSGELRRR